MPRKVLGKGLRFSLRHAPCAHICRYCLISESRNQSVSTTERIAHPFTLSLALTFAALLHLNRREPERALSLAEAVEALVAEQRLSLPLEPGIVHGAALVGQVSPMRQSPAFARA